MANHGLAWVGLIAGMKLWHVRSPEHPRPPNPSCEKRDSIEALEGVTHCLQRPGEVMVVPTAWWHATCNLEPFTFGVGGQDDCDMVDCTPPGDPNETPHEHHMRMVFCAAWQTGNTEQAESCFGGEGIQHSGLQASQGRVGGGRDWVIPKEEWLGSS
mmetsp:Transcript_6587/g.14721  ORF Transcript_6587/g.14721 Transcript_6587/m.14721 type:complete len:157 (+) Transcript_6587:430-900(+)